MIQEILNGIGFEKTGMIGFVTADGKEILSGNQEDRAKKTFYNQD